MVLSQCKIRCSTNCIEKDLLKSYCQLKCMFYEMLVLRTFKLSHRSSFVNAAVVVIKS